MRDGPCRTGHAVACISYVEKLPVITEMGGLPAVSLFLCGFEPGFA